MTNKCEILLTGGGALLPEEIISSHNLTDEVQVKCNLLCYKEPKCVGFNFRTSFNGKNCQLTNQTKPRQGFKDGDWTLFHHIKTVYAMFLYTPLLMYSYILSCGETSVLNVHYINSFTWIYIVKFVLNNWVSIHYMYTCLISMSFITFQSNYHLQTQNGMESKTNASNGTIRGIFCICTTDSISVHASVFLLRFLVHVNFVFLHVVISVKEKVWYKWKIDKTRVSFWLM